MKMINFKIFFLLTLLFFANITFPQNFWQQTEFPFFYDGDILSITANNDLVLASSSQNGLALSTNGGGVWLPLTPTPDFQPYKSVAISEFLFALGFDGFLYRSTDLGNTWHKNSNVQFFNGPIITGSNGFLYLGSHQGVYRSTNSGETWSKQNNGLVIGGGSLFTRIAVSSNGILVATTPSGVFKSTNNADSWTRVREIGASLIAVNSLGYIFTNKYSEYPYIYSDTLYRTTNNGLSWERTNHKANTLIFINPNDDAIITSLYNYDTYYSFSSDHGLTWSNISVEKSPQCIAYNGSGEYFWGTNGSGIFKSNSLTGVWHLSVYSYPGVKSFVHSILSQPGVIYVGTEKFGLYKSTNNGNSFDKISPGISSYYSADKLSSSSNGNLFAISYQGTITRSTDKGKTWNYYNAPGVLHDLYTFSLCTEGNIVLTGGNTSLGDAELGRSTDNGDNWNEVFSLAGTVSNNPNIKYSVIALASNPAGTVLGCVEKLAIYNPFSIHQSLEYSYEIIRSTDYGESWEIINMNLPKINDIRWNSSEKIFAATTQGILQSIDGGISWNYLDTTFSNVNCLVINSKDEIYIGTENNGVYISTNNGSSWSSLNQGMTDTLINSLEIGLDGFLYAGTENGGVFRSIGTIDSIRYIDTISSAAGLLYPVNNSTGITRNVELQWNSVPDIISYELQLSTDSTFNNIEFHFTDLTETSISLSDLDYACKYFWRVKTINFLYEKWSEIWNFITESLPDKFELYQNYPNPFNPKTIIKFDLPHTAKTLLKVYDILGNEVIILINEEKPAGSYEIEFNGSSLSSGIYFYKLQTENYSSIKKMILLK